MGRLAAAAAIAVALSGCSLYFGDDDDPPPSSATDAGAIPAPDAAVVPQTRCSNGEPNDSITVPSPIELGPTHEMGICPAGDVDFFSFDLEASSVLYIQAEFDNGGGAGDIDMRLYTSNQLQVDLAAGFGNEEVIRRDDLEAGGYILEVHGYQATVDNDYDLAVVVAQP